MKIKESQLFDRNIQRPSLKKIFFAPFGKTAIFYGEKRIKRLAISHVFLSFLFLVPVLVLASFFTKHLVNVWNGQEEIILSSITISMMLAHSLYRILVSTAFIWSKKLKISYQSLNSDNLISNMIIRIAYIVVFGNNVMGYISTDVLIPVNLDIEGTITTLTIIGTSLITLESIYLFGQLALLQISSYLKNKIIDEQLLALAKRAATTIDTSLPIDLNQEVVDNLILRKIS